MLKFAKAGSKGKSPVRTPDSLVSTDTVEVLLGISEGPIKGLKDGAKSFRADDTPLLNETGEANFQNFGLDVWAGDEMGHIITLDLGGFSNPINVNVNLASGIPVVRSGFVKGINAVDFRVVVNQLLQSDDKGTFKTNLALKFEVKRKTDAAWSPAWISDGSNVITGGTPGGGNGTGGLGGGSTGGGSTGGGRNAFDVNMSLQLNMPVDNGDYLSWRAYGRENETLTFSGDTQTVVTNGDPVDPPADPDLPAVAVNSSGTIFTWRSPSTGWVPEPAPTETSTYVIMGDGRRMYKPSSVTPTGARVGDLWFRGLLILVWNGTTFVRSHEFRAETPPVAVSGVWSINEKTTSPTPKDIRVFLQNAGPDDEWEYRVTKLTPDSTDTVFTEVAWESVQEINRDPMLIKGVALARIIGRASDQFTALPQWNGDWLGRVVKLPSNYDPIAKTYTGIWDGLYKIDWTDNNAFIFQDFIENDRYGMSAVFPHVVNKWKIYEFGQHCDVKVLRPDGTLRPRWTYNDYVQEPRDAKEMAQYIAGSAGARYVDDGNGIVDIVIDKDDPAVMLFTPENIGKEGFAYSYTDRLTRANEITVEFVNPDLNWQNDKRIVRDDDDIAIYGRIPENFIAVGCTDVDEAMARARRRLIGGLTEKEMINFPTNRKGKFLSEWDVILCGDPDMGRGFTGRLREVTGARSATLRDPMSFEPGITYWASFDIVNPDYPQASEKPYKIERRQITNAPGNEQTSLTFATDLPVLPEYAAFILEAPDVAGFPKPYRVTNITDDSGNGDRIRINALELNRNKWGFIDTGAEADVIRYTSFASGVVLPATNPVIGTLIRQKGLAAVRVIQLSWDKSPSQWVRRYKVFHSVDGVSQAAVEPQGTSIEIEGASDGTHVFTIVAVDVRGRESPPLSLSYNILGEARPVPPATGLRLVGGTGPSIFNDSSPLFSWEAAPPSPTFHHYLLQVYDTNTSVLLREEDVGTALEWRYDFVQNRTDGGGTARRNLTVYVFAVDQGGSTSAPVTLAVTNPSPSAPSLVVTTTLTGFDVKVSPPVERDVAGCYLWVSSTNNFNPALVTPAQDADQQSFSITTTETDVYIRAAYYDSFNKVLGQVSPSIQYATRSPAQVAAVNTDFKLVIGLKAVEDAQATLIAQSNQLYADVNTAVTGLKAQTSALLTSLNTPTTGILARLTTVENNQTGDGSATATRLNALEATVNTAGTGLTARMATAESAITTNNSAAVTRLNALESTINTAGTGLTARVGSSETAITNLTTGKADASRVTLLEAQTRAVASLAFPNRLDAASSVSFFTAADIGSAAAVSDYAGQTETVSGFGLVARGPWMIYGTRGVIDVVAGRTYEITADVENVVAGSGGASYAYIRLAQMTAGYAYHATQSVSGATVVTPLNTRMTITQRFSMPTAPAGGWAISAGVAYVRPQVVTSSIANGSANAASVTRIYELNVKDVTDDLASAGAAARLTTAESAITTNNSAAVTRLNALEATVNTAGTGLTARLGVSETAITNLTTGKADATRVTSLEATSLNTIRGEYINAVPSFTNAVSSFVPVGWTDWNAGNDLTAVTGQVSEKALRYVVPLNINRGIAASTANTGQFKGAAAPGWWVLDAVVTLEAGALNGAGMLLEVYNTNTNLQTTYLDFASDTSNLTGAVIGAGTAGRTYSFSKLVNVANTNTNRFIIYALSNWEGLGTGARPAKTIVWHLAGIRRASAAEIEAGKARGGYADITARFAASESAITTNNSAAVTRLNALEATVNTAGTGLTARLTSAESAVANLTTNKADVTRVTALEAGQTALPNLLPNSDFSANLKYWTNAGSMFNPYYDAAYGSIAGALGGATGDTYYLISDLIRIYGNTTYTISFSGDGGGVSAGAVLYCSQYNAAGNYIPDGDGLGYVTFDGVSWTKRKSTTFVTRSDCVYVKVVIAKVPLAGGAQNHNMFISRIMFNNGATVANWTDQATVRDIMARVVTEEGATAELRAKPAPGGNLLGNTTFETLDGWVFNNNLVGGLGTVPGINRDGEDWRPAPDNTVGSFDGGSTGGTADWYSDPVAVTPGTTLEFGAWGAVHRTNWIIYLELTKPGGVDYYYPDTGAWGPADGEGGRVLSSWKRAWGKAFVNPGYTRARLIMRRYHTLSGNNDSYAWFCRPYICEIPAGQTGPGTFSHGMPRWNLRAKWQVSTAIPGAEAFIQAVASNADGKASSSVAIGATAVAIYNPLGNNWKKALEVIGGNVVLTGGLQVGAFIRLGNGNGWPVALKAVDFSLTDGEVCSFGTDLGSLPAVSFGLNNLSPLNAGETYDIKAVNLTATGFTLSAKISIPATPSNLTQAGPGYVETVPGGTDGRTLAVYTQAQPFNGVYTISASGWQQHYIAGNPGNMPEYPQDGYDDASIRLSVYGFNGAWTYVGDVYAYSSAGGGQSGTTNQSWSVTETLQFPSNVSYINVTRIESSNGRPGGMSTIGPATWQAQGTGSSQRSATPNGQKTKVTVRPQ